jgi:hypothetical protein
MEARWELALPAVASMDFLHEAKKAANYLQYMKFVPVLATFCP